jgi:hypothetical protein
MRIPDVFKAFVERSLKSIITNVFHTKVVKPFLYNTITQQQKIGTSETIGNLCLDPYIILQEKGRNKF